MRPPLTPPPELMTGVVLTGYGGLERLEYRDDLPVPVPGSDDVLIQVSAAGMNNTDINTRTGWYNQQVASGTTEAGGSDGFGVASEGMGAWSGDIRFPRIQGADVTGRVVAVGSRVPDTRVGERVICDPYCREADDAVGIESAAFLGSERDGGFAQFCAVPSANAHPVPDMAISDVELATLPCSAGTAMNMMLMASIGPGDRVIVTGASGGVGTYLLQIARHLGAEVSAIASINKHKSLRHLGAHLIDRNTTNPVKDAADALGDSPTAVADVVGGPAFGPLIESLGRGGRYVTAGAIGGPLVQLDLRTLYLKNLEFYGSTAYRRDTFPSLLRILGEGGISPIVDSEWPLDQIADAQRRFLTRSHVGSMVLRPPALEAT